MQQKYLAISQEHEQILKEKDVILQKMHTVESDYKSQVSKLESDLEDQRAKNNVSRHCTVMRIVHFLSGLIFNASRPDFVSPR